jgi:hypothetical protein
MELHGESKRDIIKYDELVSQLAELPPEPRDALPTRFGNSIRAFELYPREAYGADEVPLWLRVAALAPKDLLETVADRRAQVDFMVNCSFFSFVLTLCLTVDHHGQSDMTGRVCYRLGARGWNGRCVWLGGRLMVSLEVAR